MTALLNASYCRDPKKFLEKHPLVVPTTIAGQPHTYRDGLLQTVVTDQNGSLPGADDHPGKNDALLLRGFGNDDPPELVVHCDINPVDDPFLPTPKWNPGFSLEAGAGTFESYFLPWQMDRITRVPLGGAGPAFFFTSSLTGCTIYVTGTEQAPTVYHANARGIGEEDEDDVRQEYMERLFSKANRPEAPLLYKLAKRDYRMEPELARKRRQGRVFVRRGALNEEDVALEETTVIGVRKRGAWKFYYQMNIYMKFDRPAYALGIRIREGTRFTGIKSYCRPLPAP
jgi:hypothetical protein